jgi:hypothetical protein
MTSLEVTGLLQNFARLRCHDSVPFCIILSEQAEVELEMMEAQSPFLLHFSARSELRAGLSSPACAKESGGLTAHLYHDVDNLVLRIRSEQAGTVPEVTSSGLKGSIARMMSLVVRGSTQKAVLSAAVFC